MSGTGVWNTGPDANAAAIEILTPALEAFKTHNRGSDPAYPDELLPYIATEAEQAALEQLVEEVRRTMREE